MALESTLVMKLEGQTRRNGEVISDTKITFEWSYNPMELLKSLTEEGQDLKKSAEKLILQLMGKKQAS